LLYFLYDDSIALRDGADPNTGFDVLSIDADPRHSTLKWADELLAASQLKIFHQLDRL